MRFINHFDSSFGLTKGLSLDFTKSGALIKLLSLSYISLVVDLVFNCKRLLSLMPKVHFQ